MIKQYSRRNIFGLDEALNGKIAISAIMGTLDEVENSNTTATVPSTASIVELRANLEKQIEDANKNAKGLIDDTVESAADKTWSVDKIKEFIASVDDTVVVANISERDNLNAYDSLIAYVIDTSDDENLGDEAGNPYAYIYADGEWSLLAPLSKEIDTTVFVKKDMIVNDYTTGGSDKVLSAEAGKQIVDSAIPQAINANDVRVINESIEVKEDKLELLVNPVGDLIMACAEVSTDNGIEVVDASVTGDREVTLSPNESGEYDGKTARISYLARTADVIAAQNSDDDSDSDGE